MSESETESEEELQDIENNNELSVPPMDEDQQRSAETEVHTDEDFSDHESMIENEHDEDDEDYVGGLPMGHKRTGSLAEKRESIQRQKLLMEQKLRTLSQQLDGGILSIYKYKANMRYILIAKTQIY